MSLLIQYIVAVSEKQFWKYAMAAEYGNVVREIKEREAVKLTLVLQKDH